jgi:hypothetical protein
MGERRYSTIAPLDGVVVQIHVPVALSAHEISDTHCKIGWFGFEYDLERLKKSVSLPAIEIKYQNIKSAPSIIH